MKGTRVLSPGDSLARLRPIVIAGAVYRVRRKVTEREERTDVRDRRYFFHSGGKRLKNGTGNHRGEAGTCSAGREGNPVIWCE